MNKAIFFDLDHTLIRPRSGDTFPRDISDWEWIPGVLNRLYHLLAKEPQPVIIVTNQGGVVAGFQTKEDIEKKLRNIRFAFQELVKHPHVHTYVAYTYDYHRKPSPGMAYQAALEHELDLAGSVMVGDMESDKEFAKNAGIGAFCWAADYFNWGPAKEAPSRVRQG